MKSPAPLTVGRWIFNIFAFYGSLVLLDWAKSLGNSGYQQAAKAFLFLLSGIAISILTIEALDDIFPPDKPDDHDIDPDDFFGPDGHA